MRLWAANRAALPVLVLSFIAAWLGLPGSAVFVAFPNLTGGRALTAPLSAVLPLVTALALTVGLARQDAVRESLARRRIWLLDLALVALALAFVAASAIVIGGSVLWESFRNALGYCGLTLLSAALFSLRAAALPAFAWAFASAVCLLPMSSDLLSWPMAPASAPLSWAIPLCLILVGPVAYLVRIPTL